MAVILPLVAGAGLLGAGWLFGKSGSGGITSEILTKKEYTSTQTTQTYAPTYAPTITRTYEYAPQIITGSPYATMETKKESSIAQTPQVSPTVAIIPTTAQSSPLGAGSSGGVNIWDFVIIGAIGTGAYLLLKKKK